MNLSEARRGFAYGIAVYETFGDNVITDDKQKFVRVEADEWNLALAELEKSSNYF